MRRALFLLFLLLPLQALAGVQLTHVNSFTLQGYAFGAPYYNGLLVEAYQFNAINLYLNLNFTISSSLYYLNSTSALRLVNFPAPNNVSVVLLPEANSTVVAVNALYLNNSYSSPEAILSHAYVNVTFVKGTRVLGFKLFHNFTLVFPTEQGADYVYYTTSGSVVRTPQGVFYLKGEYVYDLNDTPYGTIAIAEPSPFLSAPFLLVKRTVENFTLYNLGKWNVTFRANSTSAQFYLLGNEVLVSNGSETFFVNAEDGQVVKTLPYGTLVGATEVNGTQYLVDGDYLFINGTPHALPNIATPTYATFGRDFIVVVGMNSLKTEVFMDLIGYNGSLVYSQGYTYNVLTGTISLPIYSHGYVYVFENNAYTGTTTVEVYRLVFTAPSTTTTTTVTTTYTTTYTTTSTTTSVSTVTKTVNQTVTVTYTTTLVSTVTSVVTSTITTTVTQTAEVYGLAGAVVVLLAVVAFLLLRRR